MEAKLVEVLQVLAPDRFLVREKSLKNEEQVISKDVEMHLLNSGTFNKSDCTFEINEICCYFAEGMFYRVRIEDLEGIDDPVARCTFLDTKHESLNVSTEKLRKLPGHLIGRPSLVKEVTLRGIQPHSLFIMHNLDLKFGPVRKYDESAHFFVRELVSKSENWMCLMEREPFGGPVPEVVLYYASCRGRPEPSTFEGAHEAVHFEEDECRRTTGTTIRLSKVRGWRKGLEEFNWVSLNRTLIEKNFACLLEGTSSEDFELYLTKTSVTASSERSKIPASIEEMAYRIKASVRDLIGYGPAIVDTSSSRSTEGGGAKCTGRGRGALLKLCMEKSPGMDSSPSLKIPCWNRNISTSSDKPDSLTTTSPVISGVFQRCSLDSDDSAKMTSQQSCPPDSSVKPPRPFRPAPGSTTHEMRGAPEVETNPFVEDCKKSSSVCDFQKLETREVGDCSKSEPMKLSTLPSKSIPTEKSEIVTKTSRTVAQDYKGRQEDLQKHFARSRDARLRPDESQRAKVKNLPRMKYNPMSQMLFGRGRPDVLNPCLVNNILKASPDGSIWLDSSCDVDPILDLQDVEFYQLIKRDKHFSTMTSPTLLQSYAWPMISKLSDFFGIGPSPGRTPSTENFRGGKTACYVFPILWQLNNTACYSDLPPKCDSPIVIIVCPSSKHVMKVHSQVASLLTHQDDLPNKGVDLTASYLFGRCEQAKQEASAKSGSHILVCTPNCLLRMFDRSATSFDRLCHLVFEEADILLHVFKPQVERIMDGLRLASMNRKSDASPRQVLVFSQHWTPELDSFVAGNLVDPTVAIATAMEAFYSAGVKTDVECCSPSTKFERLTSILDEQLSLEWQQKIVVLCATDVEAEHISRKLESLCQQKQTRKFLANNSTEDKSLEEMFSVWKDSRNIVIVASDEMLQQIEGTTSNSTCVVHADVPKKQQALASRLWLMRDHFQKTSTRAKQLESTKESSISARTVLLLSSEEMNSLHLSNLATFLKRAGVRELPDEMEELRSGSMAHVARLCDNFKSFGFCSNHLHCKLRHHFSQQQDVDELRGTFVQVPFFSIVKIRVTFVKSPFVYNSQILEWVEHGRESQPIPHNDAKILALRLARQYGHFGNKTVKPENLVLNDLYAWKAQNGVAFRAKLLWVDQIDITPVEARILLVDLGDVIQVKVTEILELIDALKEMPYQAMEICVCRLKTVDQDPNWNHQDKDFVEKRLGISLLTGRVVFRVGPTLWLDPLEECEKLSNLKVWITTLDLRRAMLDVGVAEENPEHIQFLLNSSNDLVDLPDSLKSDASTSYGYSCHGLFLSTSVEELKDKFTPVYVTSAKNPHSFYVQKAINEERLEKLHKDIEKGIQLGEILWIGVVPLVKEMLVLVKDGRWKRAKVLSNSEAEDDEVFIFLVDFGMSFLVDRANVFQMPVRFKDDLPFQAIECLFSGLEPRRTGTASGENRPLPLEFSESHEAHVEEKISESRDEMMIRVQRRTPKPHLGTSVDPGGSSDDDDDDIVGAAGDTTLVGRSEISASIETECNMQGAQEITDASPEVNESSEVNVDHLNIGRCSPASPLTEVEPPSWGSDIADYIMDITGDISNSHLLTAVLVSPKNGENKHAVRLYGYQTGDFVTDLAQKMVADCKASLTKQAVQDMFVTIGGDDDNDAKREFVKNLCSAFLMGEDPQTNHKIAKKILHEVNHLSDSSTRKGSVRMLSLLLKYNRHRSSFWPIMKALGTLWDSNSDHCSEARTSYLWDSICFHLYNDKSGSVQGVTSVGMIIIENLVPLLTCKICCEEFLEKGGIKALGHFIKFNSLNDDDVVLCIGLLGHLVRSLLTKSGKQDATEIEGDSSITTDEHLKVMAADEATDEKFEGAEATDATIEATRDISTTAENTDISKPESRVEDDEDEDDAFLKMDEAIPLLKKIFEEESSVERGVSDVRPSSSSEDREEEEEDGERGDAEVRPETRFFQLHRELNMSPEALMTNVWRNPRSNLDLMECMEVVAVTTESRFADSVVLASIYLLAYITHKNADNLLPLMRKLRTAGGLNSLVEILKMRQDNEELLKEVLYLLRYVARCDVYMRDYLRSLDLYDTTAWIKSTIVDDEMNHLTSKLLEALTKKKANVATTTDDAFVAKQPPSLQGLAKSTPTVYWSNVDEECLKLRVEARNVFPESLDVIYSDDSITFKALSDTTEYSFHLQLVHPLVPTECTSFVRSSEVVVLLTKSERRVWDRLVFGKNFSVRPDLDVLEKQVTEEEKEEVDKQLEDLPRFALNDTDDEDDLSGDEQEPFMDL